MVFLFTIGAMVISRPTITLIVVSFSGRLPSIPFGTSVFFVVSVIVFIPASSTIVFVAWIPFVFLVILGILVTVFPLMTTIMDPARVLQLLLVLPIWILVCFAVSFNLLLDYCQITYNIFDSSAQMQFCQFEILDPSSRNVLGYCFGDEVFFRERLPVSLH
jgi:hypothetical protein